MTAGDISTHSSQGWCVPACMCVCVCARKIVKMLKLLYKNKILCSKYKDQCLSIFALKSRYRRRSLGLRLHGLGSFQILYWLSLLLVYTIVSSDLCTQCGTLAVYRD